MGEYALYHGKEIKIGTCESMYYLRYEDRFKVRYKPGNVNAASDKDLFWRLPYPDEDHVQPGGYEDYNRCQRLYLGNDNYTNPSLAEHPSTIQLRHESGLLINVPCYHGEQLPECGKDVKVFWNGKSWFYELQFIKNTSDQGIRPIIGCRHCNQMWRMDWDEVLPYIGDLELRRRLSVYQIPQDNQAA